MYSNQVYHAAIIELFKTYSKHIDIKDINVSMINHSYIKKYNYLFTQMHDTH